MESSEIDLSEFQEENRGDGGDGNDNNRDADDQAGNQQAAGTNGEVSLTHFTLNYLS